MKILFILTYKIYRTKNVEGKMFKNYNKNNKFTLREQKIRNKLLENKLLHGIQIK